MMNLNRIIGRTEVLTVFATLSFFLLLLLPLSSWANQQTILVVGDSLGAGYGIPQGKEWVQGLARRLEKNGGYRVVNASISGDTTAGGLARLPALLEAEQPSWVLIELGGNDGLRGMSLKAMKQNLFSMVNLVEQKGAQPILIGIKIPPNYGKKYTQKFERVFEDVAKEADIPLLPFLLEGVAGWDQYMQSDRIHPNVQAQPIIENLVWEFLEPIVQAEAD